MNRVFYVAMLLLALTWSHPQALLGQNVVLQAQPRRNVVVVGEDGVPQVILGSANILARNDLVGLWQAASFEYEGVARPDVAAGLKMRFSRGRLELMQQGRATIVASYTLDVGYEPMQFSWSVTDRYPYGLQQGLYYLEGDKLVICLGAPSAPPATEFLTQPRDGRSLYVLRRVEPLKK